MDILPYNRYNLPSYLKAKLESAKELFDAGKISKAELWRHELDLIHMTDTGPIKLTPDPARKEVMPNVGLA